MSATDVAGLQLDAELLTPMVRRALDDEGAEVTDFTTSQLQAGIGNPTSAGLYRLSGAASHAGRTREWSMVLKAIQSPASVGVIDFGEEPEHWNYWKRELHAFQTGLLAHLPGGLLAPRYHGSIETDERAWLLIEDIGALDRSSWTAAACRRAARHLGAFEGAFLAGTPFPREPWLADDLLAGWAARYVAPVAPLLDLLAEPDGPFAVAHHSVSTRQIDWLVRCLTEPSRLLAALAGLPQAPSHQDANIDNLQLRGGPDGESRLMALDWQLMGRAPVGASVGQLLASVGDEGGPPIWAKEESILEAYVAGLGQAGARVDPADVRLGYLASTVLRQAIFMFYFLTLQLGAAGVQPRDDAGLAQVEDFARANEQTLARLAIFSELAEGMLEG